MTEHRLTFQDAVARLERFWADQGCLIWQPYNVEVGAGTMNPATFLHVLGPESWNVAYVEPSVRPDDGRYGENPNRMGRHHQYQVILKPDPGDPQGLYLASLAALGIDLARHDVRFVEDNWESPALGAWGLGWEVWLDGLEITQFTYFQQAGSVDLDPPSIEITYGLDRILMALQDAAHFKDLWWNDKVRFGDVLLAGEVQTSRYWFDLADVARLKQLYDLYDAEAVLALDHGLVRPAHDYVLKCSHVFNILDARGTVGVTERARFFARMRKLSRRVAEAFVAERTALAFPLGGDPAGRGWVAGSTAASASPDPASADRGTPPSAPADFVLEVGVEELPVGDLDLALAALAERVPALLADLRLAHAGVTVHGTPRRLAVHVAALHPRQPDVAAQVVGPPARAAYDADGRPTKAAEGFARSAGVAVGDLSTIEQKGEARLAAVRLDVGRPSVDVLAEALPGLLAGLPCARAMRWNASRQAFARPVRWLVALHGTAVVPVAFAGLEAGRVTRGLRPESRRLAVAAAEDYRKVMRTHGIQVDPAARKAEIGRQVATLAASVGGHVPTDTALEDEVANLVEEPRALLGDFEPRFLELPDAVLKTVMKKHQRYFPVVDADGRLMPHFVAVANRAGIDADVVRHGNAAVLRARFADAAYFWKQDTRRPLADFTAALDGLMFQADLGSMRDKVARLGRLTPLVGRRIGLNETDLGHAARAAALAKSDLTTAMVVDFTSLQGVMGAAYARLSGEPEAVAIAVDEQYRPRGAGDAVPATGPGTALALADRLDSLVGLFAAGLRPKGTNDPYALRRAALGITAILVERGLSLDLRAAVDDAAGGIPIAVTDAVRNDVLDFLRRRLAFLLREAGHAADAVAAVLAVQGHDPAAAARDVRHLEAHVARPDWNATLTAYARCARIVRGRDDVVDAVDGARLAEPAERVLADALDAATQGLSGSGLNAALNALAALAPAINAFFDAVLVMADDPAVRANRLALAGRVAAIPARFADLSELEGF
ncbi:glycine--tRNA ligase subunit alpha/beta [bacterium]|nr:MAG: glycine--tRNA ligase subunit alpha/beta [bacterium]